MRQLFRLLVLLNFIEQEGTFHHEVIMVVPVLIVDHQQASGIVSGRFRYNLTVCDGVQPIFQVVRTQVATVMLKINDLGELVEGEQVISLFIELFLQVNDVVAVKPASGALAQENIPAPIEGDEVAEAVLTQVFDQEVLDWHPGGTELIEGSGQFLFFQSEIFTEWFTTVCAHIHHLLNATDCMPQFIYFRVDAHEVNIGVVDEGLYENSVGVLFKYQQADFTNGVEIGISSVNVAVL